MQSNTQTALIGQDPRAHRNGAHLQTGANGYPPLSTPQKENIGPQWLEWICPTSEKQITLAMRDRDAAEYVFLKFPDLQLNNAIAKAIYDARRESLKNSDSYDIEFNHYALTALNDKSFEEEVCTEAARILELSLCAPPIKNPRQAAFREAHALYRLANPLFAMSDAGNGERFAWRNMDNARFCVEFKKWLIWNGKFWEKCVKGEVERMAKETARHIPTEAKHPGADYATTLKWALKSESNERLNAMLRQAATEEGMTVVANELDTDKWAFNVKNGTIDLRTGQLKPHDREDLMTRFSPFDYDPKSTCPQFLEFLNKIFLEREGLILFLQRLVGYSLTGETREQIFVVLHGEGSNGKGVLIKILLELFGSYGYQIDPKTLYVRQYEGMATDIAELAGRRFVAGSEGNEGKRIDEALIKRITGEDRLTGERKYENEFTFLPEFQLFFATNHAPEIRGTDHSIWRRVQKIPFDAQFWNAEKGESGEPGLEADTTLFEKLKTEMSGILAWAVTGCLNWQKDGIGTPDEVRAATLAYRDQQDVLARFIAERCLIVPGALVKSGELYAAYTNWADQSGIEKISQTALGKRLREHGYQQSSNTSKREWKGLGLLAKYE